MIKKKVLFLLFLLVLFSSFSVVNGRVSSSNFTVVLGDGGSLGFQNQIEKYLIITVEDGTLNSSVNTLQVSLYKGRFIFNASEAVNFSISFVEISNVFVAGDQGNEIRLIQNNDVFIVDQYNQVQILWNILLEPWFSAMFAFGMVGLALTVAGPSYAMLKIKKMQLKSGLVWGTVYTVLGIALVMGWLWS